MTDRDQEIIATLRNTYEAFSRGDFEATTKMAHPEIEFVAPQSKLKGPEAIRAWMRPDAFEEQIIEPLEFRVNGNRALVRQRVRARGAGSGVVVDMEMWGVWTLDDDGLVTRQESFLLHQEAEALEAAGFESPAL